MAQWLRERGHDVVSIFDEAPGTPDPLVIRRAYDEGRILISNDKDFGDHVYRSRHPHHGVILLRLADERSRNKIMVLERLLVHHADELPDRFVVVTERQVRFASEVR